MKNIIPFISLLFFVSIYSQTDSLSVEKEKKSSLKFMGGFNTNRIIFNTKLSDKWSFQNELIFSKIEENRFVEIPLLLNYNITNRWRIFLGPKLDYSLKNKYGFANDTSPTFGVSAEFGSHYDFKNNFFGEIKFDHSFTKNMNTSALGFKNVAKGEVVKLRLGRSF
ncbi:MAG: PorT family protein [Flavobacteriaceae bacterium]|nr:PorT family protein [Flavobacteriaceae bacterium]